MVGVGVGVLVREEVTLKENLNSEEELTVWGQLWDQSDQQADMSLRRNNAAVLTLLSVEELGV